MSDGIHPSYEEYEAMGADYMPETPAPPIAGFSAWVSYRWAGGQKEQQQPHAVPFSPIAALGLAGEVGEVIEHLKKHMRDGKHPGDALKLELGDVLHYLTVLAGAYGWTLDELAQANIAKLEARDAKSRAEKLERDICAFRAMGGF